jgi:PQQ-dependent dehydrogenase (methanol/ethanol family)
MSRLPFALLVSLAVIVAASSQTRTAQRNPVAGDLAAVRAGEARFQRSCTSCHSVEGRAPALTMGVFTHGGQDAEIFQTIRTGVPGTQMPPFAALTDDEIWQLVAYIRSLASGGGGTADRGAESTATGGGDPIAGEAIFSGSGGCVSCHEVNGHGGTVGPDLSAAGTRTVDSLRQKIVDPNAAMAAPGRGRGAAAPAVIVARLRDGREIHGVRRNEDTFSLQMIDASGQLHLLQKSTLADLRYEDRSLMPGDYATRLSANEISDLVAYLRTLQARDLTKTSVAPLTGGVTFDGIQRAHAEPHNWLTYWGDYHGTHFSTLKQITPANVAQLQAKWAIQLPGASTIEATPLVIDGVMYTSGPPGTVVALDAGTGRQIWRYQRPQNVRNPNEINPFNRGVAVLGPRVFVGTLDATLIALDIRTGLPLWEVQMADTMQGYSITSPPLPVKDRIIAGIAGGEFGTRGFIDAYDAATGKRLWRFNTIPEPGEFGHDTWKGDSWKLGCGATWMPGSYDADLDLVYWAVGNPCPLYDGSAREGDNLFTSSVVALDSATGQRKWHYQFTPHDTHDWDAVQDMVLVDRPYRGQPRKLLMHADRNGHFYVLDRSNGKFLSGTPFIRQTWNKGFDANGRPMPNPDSEASPTGAVIAPTLGGATNFQAPSYSTETGWFYLAYSENSQRFFSEKQTFEPGQQYRGGRGASTGERGSAGIKALDPDDGKTVWDFKLYQGSLTSGVLATSGGLVFGATRDGYLIALDAKTGRALWRFQTGAAVESSPMSFAVNGKQFVAVSAGNVVYAFALPDDVR